MLKNIFKIILAGVALAAYIVWVVYVDRNGGFNVVGVGWMLLVISLAVAAIISVHRFGGKKMWLSTVVTILVFFAGAVIINISIASIGWQGVVNSFTTILAFALLIGFSWLISRGLPAKLSFKKTDPDAANIAAT